MVRSKNAGPRLLTLDVALPDASTYMRVLGSGMLGPDVIARLYGVSIAHVTTIGHDRTHTIKVTFPRPIVAGDPGDTDLYGAQQYIPLLDLEVPA